MITTLHKSITAVFLTALMLLSLTVSSFAAEEKYIVPDEELAYQNNTEYRGEGMVVAIIDKSFNLGLSHWVLTDDSTAKITEETLADVKGELNAKKFTYYNAKIPFVYNYHDEKAKNLSVDIHGTHIAGLIGANDKDSGNGFNGVVPEAQLLFMSVFDGYNSADPALICAAVYDAIVLGADVINMSVGILAGFEDGFPFDEEVTAAIAAAEEAGISVICAAGNAGNNYEGSYYANLYDINLPMVNVIDNGTVATPAVMESTVAVGSLASDFESWYYITLNDEDETKIKMNDSTRFDIPDLGGSFLHLFDGEILEYEVIPGLGMPEDFEGIDVTDKLALISRGDITFVDKLLNAEAAGAVGAIIYNNIPYAGANVTMVIEGANIPAVFISMEDGLLMAESETKSITVADADPYFFGSANGGLPLSLTSMGPTPGLKIKPDVMAKGGDVLSLAAMEGDLRRLTGTSMSAGYVSGVTAMLKQYLRASDMPEDPAYVRKLLINSAKPTAIDGVMFGPRVQGGGVIDIDSLFDTEVLLTGRDGRAKIELGDNLTKTFKIDYTITNVTDEPMTAVIKSAVLTDGYLTFDIEEEETVPYFISDVSAAVTDAKVYADNLYTNVNIYSDSYKEYEIELAAGESRDLALTVYLSGDFVKANAKIFTEGFFIDGYIMAEVMETGSVSSIPFMGFYGDWANLTILDNTMYDGKNSYFGQTGLYTYISYSGIEAMWVAGKNFIDEYAAAETKHIAFSPNFDGMADEIYMSLAFLRSATVEVMNITDSDGNIIDEITEPVFLQKTILAPDYFNLISSMLWAGDDGVNELYIYPDGEYKLTLTMRSVYDGAKPQTYVIPFMLDTEMPEAAEYDITATDDGLVLTVKCTDNHCIQGVSFYDTFSDIYTDMTNYAHDDSECGAVEFSMNLEEFIENGARYIYVDIFDYAFNSTTIKIDLIDYLLG